LLNSIFCQNFRSGLKDALSSTLMKETLRKDKFRKEKVCVSIRGNHFVGGTVNKRARLHSIPDEKFLQFSTCVQSLCDEQKFLVN
jgi:hypothetical protein